MQDRRQLRRKVLPIAVSVMAAIAVTTTAIISTSGRRSAEPYHLMDYTQGEISRLNNLVTQREVVIQQMIDRIRHRDSLILVLENKRTSVTNKYYYNEKEILTSSDSVNHAMRLINQSAFESDYFSGKYAPSK